MSTTSFKKKIIQVSLTLSDGVPFLGQIKTLPDGTTALERGNTLTLQDLRMSVDIRKPGPPAKNSCRVRIYGMTEAHMNQCTVIPAQQTALKFPASKKVYMRIAAGDTDGLNVIYEGEISEAFASYKSPPNMYFQIESITGYYPVLLPVKPRGYQGGVNAEQIIKDIADSIGYGFQNNGFSGMLQNPYLTGTAMDQVDQVARAMKSTMNIQVDDMVIYVSPKNAPRLQGGQVPLISAETGMREYPTFDKHGLRVETLFNPAVKFGGQIYVKSSIPVMNGYWLVNGLTHHLEANKPGGQWLTRINANFLRGA